MEKVSKIGLLCLIVALVLLAFINLIAPIALGLLYYAYKLIYKKETLANKDKIIITILFVLLLLEIFLFVYFASAFSTIYGTSPPLTSA